MPLSALSSEQQLWRAVLSQAIADATSKGNGREAREERGPAQDWLGKPSRHLAFVCDLAGVDMHRLIANVKESIATGKLPQRKEYQRKAQTVRLLTLGNESLSVTQWAKRYNLPEPTLRNRLKRGIPLAEAIKPTVKRAKPQCPRLGNKPKPPKTQPTERIGKEAWLEHRGERHTITQWARITGLSHRTIRSRLAYGWSIARALTRPASTRARKQDDTGGGSELLTIAPGPAVPIRARSDEIQVSMNKDSSSCP